MQRHSISLPFFPAFICKSLAPSNGAARFFFRLRNYIKSIDVKMKAETDELMDFHLHGPSGRLLVKCRMVMVSCRQLLAWFVIARFGFHWKKA